MKYAWIDPQRRHYPLLVLCEVLSVSLNGYRAWKRGGTPERRRLSDGQLPALLRAIHAEVKGAYGSPRMTEEIRSRGFPASKARVERVMRENHIRARHKRRYRVTTDSKHKLPVAPNLLNREFTMAWFRRKPQPGAIHHSDRGSQYASHDFQRKLADYGMRFSMSRKGNCWDNAPTESFFNSLKNEGTRHALPDAPGCHVGPVRTYRTNLNRQMPDGNVVFEDAHGGSSDQSFA
jgi:putative transposase